MGAEQGGLVMPDRVHLLIGTRKEAFIDSSNDRHSWAVEGPILPGWSVYHTVAD